MKLFVAKEPPGETRVAVSPDSVKRFAGLGIETVVESGAGDLAGMPDRMLAEAGASVADVVRTVVYVTDIALAEQVARAHGEIFATIRPASTMVAVSALIRPELLVEIEAYAIVPDDAENR